MTMVQKTNKLARSCPNVYLKFLHCLAQVQNTLTFCFPYSLYSRRKIIPGFNLYKLRGVLSCNH